MPARSTPALLAVMLVSTLAAAVEPGPPERDRAAILAMAGAFQVDFRFEETVAVGSGVALEAPYLATATELVEVLADEGDLISLQHILVVDDGDAAPHIVKHWRQDWRYEDTELLTFRGHATWQREDRAPSAARGTWTQAVFQTTDAPRYEAAGRWIHTGAHSTWESELTWRPLPRRERHRRDYHVVLCRNRHTVTPTGWVHEQQNQKLVLADDGAPVDIVAHETGVNTYRRVDPALLAPATAYWTAHEAAWADVRDAWRNILDRDRLTLVRKRDGVSLSRVVSEALTDADLRQTLGARLERYLAD